MHPRIVFSVLLVTLAVTHADDQVRSTQEELRRRNIFFGDIDGRRSAEYREAVRRYQERKGLTKSGEEDRDTLRSLGLLPRSANEPPPKELSWPDEPVLRSDARLDVEAVARQIASETGVPAGVIAPAAAGSSTAPKKRRGSVPAAAAPKTARAPSGGAARFSPRDESLASDLRKLVADYVHALARNDLAEELQFYADHVNYYGQRQVDRRIIEQSLRSYYVRWPKRDYKLLPLVRYQVNPSRAEIVVTFSVSFVLSNGGAKVRGEIENQVTINAATSDPRIVSIQERRVRQ